MTPRFTSMIWTRLMTSGLVCRRVGDEPEPEAVDAIAEGREVLPPRVPGVRVFGDRDLEPDRAEWDVELADGRHAEDLAPRATGRDAHGEREGLRFTEPNGCLGPTTRPRHQSSTGGRLEESLAGSAW